MCATWKRIFELENGKIDKAKLNFDPLTDKQVAKMVLKPLLRRETLQTVDGRVKTVDVHTHQRFLECSAVRLLFSDKSEP